MNIAVAIIRGADDDEDGDNDGDDHDDAIDDERDANNNYDDNGDCLRVRRCISLYQYLTVSWCLGCGNSLP